MKSGYVGLAALTTADMSLTGYALGKGFTEANPLYKPLADSPLALGLVNGAVSGTIGLLAYKLHKSRPTLAKAFLWTMTGLKAVVVVHNYRVIRNSLVR